MPSRYDFLYIFQTTCTIILKFSVSNYLSVSAKKRKTLKILVFLILMATPMLQMGMNKISTFLYIKVFIVSIGLFVIYLILECLFMVTYNL